MKQYTDRHDNPNLNTYMHAAFRNLGKQTLYVDVHSASSPVEYSILINVVLTEVAASEDCTNFLQLQLVNLRRFSP